MIEFLKEALGEYPECHESYTQTQRDGTTFLKVQVDLGDGEGLKWFCISAHEVAA